MTGNYSKLYICLIIVFICSLSKHDPSIYLAWLNMTFLCLIFFTIFGIFFKSQFLKSVWSKLILDDSKLELENLHPIRTDFLKVTSQFPLKEQLLKIARAKLHPSNTTLQVVNIALGILDLLNETLCLNEILVKFTLSSFLFSKIICFFVSLKLTNYFCLLAPPILSHIHLPFFLYQMKEYFSTSATDKNQPLSLICLTLLHEVVNLLKLLSFHVVNSRYNDNGSHLCLWKL